MLECLSAKVDRNEKKKLAKDVESVLKFLKKLTITFSSCKCTLQMKTKLLARWPFNLNPENERTQLEKMPSNNLGSYKNSNFILFAGFLGEDTSKKMIWS